MYCGLISFLLQLLGWNRYRLARSLIAASCMLSSNHVAICSMFRPLRRKPTCKKHDLVQSGKSSLMSWPDVKLIPQRNKQFYTIQFFFFLKILIMVVVSLVDFLKILKRIYVMLFSYRYKNQSLPHLSSDKIFQNQYFIQCLKTNTELGMDGTASPDQIDQCSRSNKVTGILFLKVLWKSLGYLH